MLILTLTSSLIPVLGGLMAGILAGLFGVGGGTLVVPLLMLLGTTIHQATGLSLVYIFFTGFSGSISHWRAGNIQIRLTLLLSLSAVVSALLGVNLARQLPQRGLALLFAGFMLLVMAMFALKHRLGSAPREPLAGWRAQGASLLTGAVAGLLASVLGVGGGLVMVPLLVLLNGLSLKEATGTSLASVCLIALGSSLEHYGFGELAPALARFWLPLLLMSLAGMAGAPLGVRLNQRLPEPWLKAGFIGLCLSVLSFMLIKAFSA